MNWAIVLSRNNLHLTKKAVRTVREQDIPVRLMIVDNASTDGTAQWLQTLDITITTMLFPVQVSVAQAWNATLGFILSAKTREDYALVVNNDVELRPDTYRHLIADGGGFVTAVGVRDPGKIKSLDMPDPKAKRPHPDFSCYLIRRWVWEKVGPFDEKFEGAFCEDWDYHCRMQQAGITAECLDLPFLHHGSMTVKNADPGEKQRIMVQAEKNRQYFRKKWGFAGGSPEYYKFFSVKEPPIETDLPPEKVQEHQE